MSICFLAFYLGMTKLCIKYQLPGPKVLPAFPINPLKPKALMKIVILNIKKVC